MERRRIHDLTLSDEGKTVELCGWVQNIRYGKTITFLEFQDGPLPDDTVQAVGAKEMCFDQKGRQFCKETYAVIIGKVSRLPSKYKTVKGFEIHIEKVLLANPSDPEFSNIVLDDSGPEIKLDNRHLYLRFPIMQVYSLVTDLTLKSLRKTFDKFNCIEVMVPAFSGVKCEGGSDVFEMDHLGTPVFLSQSGQMYLEVMTAALRSPTFCIEKSFRAEKSATRRHLSTFTHAEAEFHSIKTFEQYLELLQDFVKTFLTFMIEDDDRRILDQLDEFGTLIKTGEKKTRRQIIISYLEKGFLVLEHKDAIKMLRERGIKKMDGTDYEDMDDIKEAQERQLIDQLDQIILLTKFPLMSKAFYTATDPTDGTRALACDIEFPGVGEIFGTSVRESDYETLRQKLKLFTLRDLAGEFENIFEKSEIDKIKKAVLCQDAELLEHTLISCLDSIRTMNIEGICVEKLEEQVKNIPYKTYDWYFDLRKYGAGMTAGFGIGVERLVTWITGAHSIKDVCNFPRFLGRVTP